MLTVACVATIPSRERMLYNTVHSLYKQVDKVYITYNGYKPTYKWPSNVHSIDLDNSRGDAGKFYFYCHHREFADEWFFCDDDLIYPQNYIETSRKFLDKYKGAILSYHGRTIKERPIDSYYRNSRINGYRCLGGVVGDHRVDPNGALGTGVMFFNSGIDINWEDFKHRNMADIWISKFAIEQKYKMIVCNHLEGWIKHQNPDDSIFEKYQFDDKIQTRVYNSIKV